MTWTTTRLVEAGPEAVLDVLTDPRAVARWAPVPFDVEQEDERLLAGSRVRVSGRLAGRSVRFDVEVLSADDRGLALSARGPIGLDVAYELERAERGSSVRASISVLSGRGLGGRMLADATRALLAGGALDKAVDRLAREAVAMC